MTGPLRSDWRLRTECYPDRAAWLAARRLTLGASEAAALLGESPFAGPWDIYAAKRDGTEVVERDDSEGDSEGGMDLNDPLIRGQVLEPMVGRAYTARTGNPHRTVARAMGHEPWSAIGITHHAAEPWLSASLDAIVVDPERGEGCGEWKTSKVAYSWGRNGTIVPGDWDSFDRIMPKHIGIQALVQLAVTGLPFCDVMVLTGGLCFRWYRVLRHDPTLTALVREIGALYRLHIVDGVAPDLDGSEACIAACRAGLAASRSLVRPATEDEAADIAILIARRHAEEAAKRATARLLAAMGDHKKLTLPAGPRGEPHGYRVASNGTGTAF